MPPLPLALLLLLSVQINKAAVLGIDVTQGVTYLSPYFFGSFACREGRGKAVNARAGAEQEVDGLFFLRERNQIPCGLPSDHHQSCPGAVLLLRANLFHYSFPPDEVSICFHRNMLKIFILLVDCLLYFCKALRKYFFFLRSNVFLILNRGEILPLERFSVRWQLRNTSTRKEKLVP